MKRFLSVILLCALLMPGLSGCGAPKAEYGLYLNAYEEVGGLLSVTETDETGSAVTNAYSGIGMTVVQGETVGEALAHCDYADLTPRADGDSFEGWMEYTETPVTDDSGMERVLYELDPQQRLYSTGELLALKPEHDANFVAKWTSVPCEQYFVTDNQAGDWPADSLAFVFLANGGSMTFWTAEGMEFAASAYTYWMESGQALNDIMGTEAGAALLDITGEGASFAGWTVYEADAVNWSEEPVEQEGILCMAYDDSAQGPTAWLLLENAVCIRECSPTEELCGMTLEGKSLVAVASWS